jgi:LacI family transcriptional regulator
VLCPARANEELDTYRRVIAGTRVDALILSSPEIQDERVALLSELKHPFVLHGRTVTRAPHAWMDIDNEGSFRHATKHLLDLGHTRIALINGTRNLTYAMHRESGFREAMAARGLEPDDKLIGEGRMTDEVGFRLTEQFLAEKPRPTAILATSMMMTLGVVRAIRTAGLELGKDISLITHDDVFPFLNADRMVPPISTVRSSIRAAGTRVAELVIDLLAGRPAEQIHELWPVDLVIRASTGPAPA